MWGRPAHLNALVASAAQLGLAALIIVTISTRRRAWRAWALLGLAFLANMTFVGWDRAVLFNLNFTALTATDLRYQMLLFALLLIVVVIAIAPSDLGGTPATPAARRRDGTRRRPVALAVAAFGLVAALTGYVAAAGASAVHLKDQSPGLNASQSAYGNLVAAPKQYIAHMRADLDRLTRRGVVSLYDEPLLVAWGFIQFPYGPASGIVPLINPRVAFNGASKPQYLVDQSSGHVRLAHLQIRSIAATESGAACIGVTRTRESITLDITPPLSPGYWTGRIHLIPTHAATMHLVVSNTHQSYDIGDPPSWPDGTTTGVVVPAHTSEFVFSFLGEGYIHELRIVVAASTSLCLQGVEFGMPAPG